MCFDSILTEKNRGIPKRVWLNGFLNENEVDRQCDAE